MEEMQLVSKLMFGLGIVIGVYAIVYGLLIWRGYFSERTAAKSSESNSSESTE